MDWVVVIPKKARGFILIYTDFSKKKINNFQKNYSLKSVSYQKKGGRGHARPSFFWYDTAIQDLFA